MYIIIYIKLYNFNINISSYINIILNIKFIILFSSLFIYYFDINMIIINSISFRYKTNIIKFIIFNIIFDIFFKIFFDTSFTIFIIYCPKLKNVICMLYNVRVCFSLSFSLILLLTLSFS